MLKKYNEIWSKIKSLFTKEFDNLNIEFEHRILRNNESYDIPIEPKTNSRHEYLSVILLDSILIYPESYCSYKYYPQIFF